MCHDVGCEALDRPDVVDDVETPPVGRDQQVARARMHQDVINRHRRQTAERRPRRAPIEAGVQTDLRAREQQVGVCGILTRDAHRPDGGQVAGDVLPGASEVVRAIEQRRVAAPVIGTDRQVRDLVIGVPGFDSRDPLILRGCGQARRQIGPCAALVSRHPSCCDRWPRPCRARRPSDRMAQPRQHQSTRSPIMRRPWAVAT